MSNFELQKAKKDLQKHVEELEKFKAATVERELVMIKMKKEMDELKRECGK